MRIHKFWNIHVRALLLYTLAAIIITFPLVLHLNTAFIASELGQVDGFLSIWNLWWTAKAVVTIQNPFHSPYLFYPQGIDLFWLWLSLPNGLLVLPATMLFGPLTAYNLAILLSYVLGGYAAFLFIRRYCANDAAALLGGICYAFTAFHMRRIQDGVMDTASVQWVPLYLLALHSLLERPRWWLALLSGFLVLVVGLGSWYYGLFCLLYTGIASFVWAIRPGIGGRGTGEQGNRGTGEQGKTRDTRPKTRDPRPETRDPRPETRDPRPETRDPRPETILPQGSSVQTQHIASLQTQHIASLQTQHIASLRKAHFNIQHFVWGLTPIFVWMLLVAPQLIQMLQHGDKQFGIALEENASNSADLLAFFLPNPFHPLWGAAISDWYAQIHPEAKRVWQVSFGWLALGLVAVAVWAYGLRRLWRWLLLLVLLVLFAMGERLVVAGVQTGIPLPYALIAQLPGIRTSHRPNHITIIAFMLVALLASYGAAALLERLKGHWRGLAIGLMLLIFIGIDGWRGPLPMYSLAIPAGYASLPAPDGGALLPVPLNLNVARSEQLWYQTAHGWPIIGGYTGREPDYPLGQYAPGIREIRYGRFEEQDIIRPGWPEDQRAMLSALNIRYVVFHPKLMKSSYELQRQLIRAMGLSPSLVSPDLELYPVPEQPPRMLAFLGDGWGALERDGERRWRWMGDKTAELYIHNPYPEARPVTIKLTAEAYGEDRPLQVVVDKQHFDITITRSRVQRSLSFILPPGTHVVYFRSIADQETNRSIVFLSIEL